MKKRLLIIVFIIILGLISIETYFRLKEKPNYLELDYKIFYEENVANSSKELSKNSLFTIYFTHYDANSYVLFSNNDKYSLLDAIEKGYVFLGDILKEVDTYKEANFTLKVEENKDNDLIKKLSKKKTIIYYYNISSMKVISNDGKINESILDLINDNKLNIDYLLESLETDVYNKKCKFSNSNTYNLYECLDYNIKINKEKTELIFGNKNLK